MLISTLFLAPLVFAQPQAERLFENANTFMNAGRYNEAVNDFETIIKNFDQTLWAARALQKLGEYYLETEQNYPKALSYFQNIQENYPASDVAPAAYYYNSLIMEREGFTIADLEAASADLIRMRNLFPNNEWNAPALFLSGKLALRLGDYSGSLNRFQNLEFHAPKSLRLPQALHQSAMAAWFKGDKKQALLSLARLQTLFPNATEAEKATGHLRLLDRFVNPSSLQLDASFYGAAPKTYSSPVGLGIAAGFIAVKGQKEIVTTALNDRNKRQTNTSRDLSDFAVNRDGALLFVYEDKVIRSDGTPAFPTLTGTNFRDLQSLSVDQFGRIYTIDDDSRSLQVYSPKGQQLHRFSLNKPKKVRCYGHESMVLTYAGSLQRFDANFNVKGSGLALSNIVDFNFDAFGNLYVLYDRGASVKIFTHEGTQHTTLNLKNGTLPLKQASALAIDETGALYLADKRSGAVYRFQ